MKSYRFLLQEFCFTPILLFESAVFRESSRFGDLAPAGGVIAGGIGKRF